MRKRLIMNKIIIISAIILLFIKKTVVAQDTTFLLRKATQQVFINPMKHSEEYKKIASFKFSQKDSALFYSTVERLKVTKKRRFVKQLLRFPKQWVEIKFLKGKFYAYYPCDFYVDYRLQITDSCFVDDYEGPVAEDILSVVKKSENVYSFSLTHGNEFVQTKTFYIFNKTLGIAVLEEIDNQTKSKNYRLMIDVKHLIDIPLIVNNCPLQMEDEFKFDKPDYNNLIMKIRKK